MPFNGSGTFSRTDGTFNGANVWAQEQAASVPPTSTAFDTHDQDMANALSNCVTRDGQSEPTQNLPMGTKKHTNVGDATARTEYASAGQVQDSSLIYGGVSAGAAGHFELTLSPPVTTLVGGQLFTFKAHQASAAGANVVKISALADKSLVTPSGGNLVATDILNGQMAMVMYIPSTDKFQLVTPALFGSALSAIAGLAVTDGNIIVGDGSTWVAESGATARASLGLSIGTAVAGISAGANTDITALNGVPYATWVPSYTAVGGGSFSAGPTTQFARYKKIGKTVYFEINFFGRCSGTVNEVTFSLPTTAASIGDEQGGGANMRFPTGTPAKFAGLWGIANGDTKAYVRYSASYVGGAEAVKTFQTTNNWGVAINGFYEEA